ncbi:MAG: DUF393 domain-containing protein [SAR202 cluster bacterium]|nr:DUF393 domain-containing protein [SAR202 cluster bacterium]|tara:strand:+ start:120 stop:554 length:435 start_codon:yes stop_codon:yes gene_type:complete
MKNNQSEQNTNKLIVFYDGYCILCNRTIDFVIKYDKKEKILFASLQSDYAISTLSKLKYKSENIKNIDNVIYLQNTILKIKSDAILSILSDMGGIYHLSKIFYCIPRFIRDYLYDQIAKRRYKWFGKRNTCRIPTKDEIHKILG